MDIPTPPEAVAALASFVRERLAQLSGTVSDTVSGTVAGAIAPLRSRRDEVEVLPAGAADRSVTGTARQLALVLVGAAAPFAPTSYARARLIRQMHATGLLTDDEVRRAHVLLAQHDTPDAT